MVLPNTELSNIEDYENAIFKQALLNTIVAKVKFDKSRGVDKIDFNVRTTLQKIIEDITDFSEMTLVENAFENAFTLIGKINPASADSLRQGSQIAQAQFKTAAEAATSAAKEQFGKTTSAAKEQFGKTTSAAKEQLNKWNPFKSRTGTGGNKHNNFKSRRKLHRKSRRKLHRKSRRK